MKKVTLFLMISFAAVGREAPLEIVDFRARFWTVVQRDSIYHPGQQNVLPAPPVFVSISVNERPDQDLVCFLTDGLMTFDTLYMGKNPTIHLFNLPGGHYSATFIDLARKERITTRFSIESAFWERWWFPPFVLLVFTIVIGIVFYYIYKIRLRQQLQTQLIRDNIARDLHDDIGSYLSSISILSQGVESLIANHPERAKTSLGKIGDTARQIMDTMGDIVWSINPMHDSMPMVIQRMRDLASELLAEQGVATEFVLDDAVSKMTLTLDKRRDFYLIYKEAITNIHKYAQASKVKITVHREGDEVTLQIKDNGVGFQLGDSQYRKSNGGNGLMNMHARAARLGGTCTVESKEGQGTTLTFVFSM